MDGIGCALLEKIEVARNVEGMGTWQPENLICSFNAASGILNCKGQSCGAGLSVAEYVFELMDGGLAVQERGTKTNDHQRYMVGLAVDELIPNPVQFVRKLYFPGNPPGTEIQGWMGDEDAAATMMHQPIDTATDV